MDFCEKHQIPVDYKRGSKSPYSMDANLLHISYEGGGLEDPSAPADEEMWRWTVCSRGCTRSGREIIQITYQAGDPVALNGKPLSPAEMLRELNRLGGMHGVGALGHSRKPHGGYEVSRLLRDTGRHHYVVRSQGHGVHYP